MKINRLSHDEFAYEMEARGLSIGRIQNEIAKVVEFIGKRGSANLFQDYSFSFDEDKTAVKLKLEEVEKLIVSVANGGRPYHEAKLMTKIEWALSRIGQALLGNR